MKYDLNTGASVSAIAKILGIEYTLIKEFKTLLEESLLKTVTKEFVVKNKTVKYEAYDIIETLEYAYKNIEGDHIKNINIDIGE